MPNFIDFVHGGISKPSNSPIKDGSRLAEECLRKLGSINSPDKLPPRLLILLASQAYLDRANAEQLLEGVCETFSHAHNDVPLIGSTVGGVFFDGMIHPDGALLVCLASRLIEAEVSFGGDARSNPEGAVEELLKNLKLSQSKGRQTDPNPLANRLFITFLPGYSQAATGEEFYPAPHLHRLMYQGLQGRIWLVGGVSSANDPDRARTGLQFVGRQVLHDSVVAASLITGVPLGVGLNEGLSNTGTILRVAQVGADARTILKFEEGSPHEQLSNAGLDAMLAKVTATNELIVDSPRPVAGGSIQLLRTTVPGDYFEILRAEPDITDTIRSGITLARRRVYVERPIASLLFPCKSYYFRQRAGRLDMEGAFDQIQREDMADKPFVGGFFDGEIGVDKEGRSRLTNGGIGYLVFGDEMRERTPLYKGVSALAAMGPKLLAGSGPDLTSATIDDALNCALGIIVETGFPGAMISMVRSNLDRSSGTEKEFVIASAAIGPRFRTILEHTKRPCEGNDVLALIVKDPEKQPRFIPNSRQDENCDQNSIALSGIISQYILPLKRQDQTVFGTLQIDVGDLSHLTEEEFRKTEKARMLNCFAEIIGASVNRIASNIQNDIMMRLDQALKDSLSAPGLRAGLQTFLDEARAAFGVESGHLWLTDTNETSEIDDTSTRYHRTLILEAGSTRELQTTAIAPACILHTEDPQIANEVEYDRDWETMLNNVRESPGIYASLNQTRSYAAIAIRSSEGRTFGAISLSSTRPWFFLRYYKDTLKVLAERLRFLIEHLTAKVQLNFLFDVSPALGDRDLNQTEAILQYVTDNFRQVLQAEVASLYLWDQDREIYVLRAESNWADKRWVHAANYDEQAGWIGIAAINKDPLYVSDLRAYYLKKDYEDPQGRYAEHMFGRSLSHDFAVEAIGLPLRMIGQEDTEHKFGVLTLYRPIEKGQPSGFVTTNTKLLQEGAYNISGLVNAVLQHREDIWEKEEDRRRQRVYHAINSGEEGEPFAVKVCRAVLKEFHACEVNFYLAGVPDVADEYSWIAGYHRQPGTNGQLEKLTGPLCNHEDIIKKTALVSEKDNFIRRVAYHRRELPKGQAADPKQTKMGGMVDQVCIPMFGGKIVIGVLVIRWTLSPQIAFRLRVQHNSKHLQTLGNIIGSAYLRRHMMEQAEQSQLAVQTAGIYVFQHAHKLANAIQDLYSIALEISSARDEDSKQAKVDNLLETAEQNIRMITWVIELGEMVQKPALDTINLHKVLRESWQDVRDMGYRIDFPDCPAAKNLSVIADPYLTKEVFINLITNAVKSMEDKQQETGESPVLKVSTILTEDKEAVKIIVEDNGKGMTREEVEAAERGFVSGAERGSLPDMEGKISRHKGVGVLISRYLLRVQGGSLAYETVPSVGTKAVVTLPHFRVERRKTWNGMD
jgi:signal transduction histidine kinase